MEILVRLRAFLERLELQQLPAHFLCRSGSLSCSCCCASSGGSGLRGEQEQEQEREREREQERERTLHHASGSQRRLTDWQLATGNGQRTEQQQT